MAIINNGSIRDLMAASATGPFMQAEIVSLTGRGKLRITCNWLYSSLNCDPNDNSTCLWQFNKIDDQHISLASVTGCSGETGSPIYASVRDDINYYIQMQAPYSANWITAVGRDEIIGFALHDLGIAQLTGFNGAYIALNDFEDTHNDSSGNSHTGYRVRSIGCSFNQAAQWFIAPKQALQAGIQFSGIDNSAAAITKQAANNGLFIPPDIISRIAEQVSK